MALLAGQESWRRVFYKFLDLIVMSPAHFFKRCATIPSVSRGARTRCLDTNTAQFQLHFGTDYPELVAQSSPMADNSRNICKQARDHKGIR